MRPAPAPSTAAQVAGLLAALAEPAPIPRRRASSFAAGEGSGVTPSASLYRAQAVAIDIALSIPAMRRAVVVLLTPATFTLSAWQGTTRLAPTDPRSSWLRQPDPRRSLMWTLARTLSDGLWFDRCVWRMTRNIAGQPSRFERVHPNRYTSIDDPLDPDTAIGWILDGQTLSVTEFERDHVVFDFAGLGGLRRLGAPLLGVYADLQAAAGNYARSPHPADILRNSGADLTTEEIDSLLSTWETNRARRSTAYLPASLTYEAQGWSARELQLVEAREHAALEVARLVGLPAFAVDAKSGDSMTYGNTVDRRRDVAEALRPWMTAITQTLSLDDRTGRPAGRVLPAGVVAEFDVDAYTRDDPETRMRTWDLALSSGVLDRDEVRAAEPLAGSAHVQS